MRCTIIFVLALGLHVTPSVAYTFNDFFSNPLKISAVLAVAGSAYYWWRTPLHVVPELNNLNLLTFNPTKTPMGTSRTIEDICTALQQKRNAENHTNHITIKGNTYNLSHDIPEHKKVILMYVSGYAGMSGNARYKYVGSGAYALSKYANGGMLDNVTCVTYDGQVNDRRTFNFGQELDQECLHVIYKEIVRQNPEADIILFGSCKGAVVIQNFISNPAYTASLAPITDVILECPSLSLEHLSKHIAQTHVPNGLQWLLPTLFNAIFPNYKAHQKTVLDTVHHIPDRIKVHIACLPHDHITSYTDICAMIESLQHAGKRVDVLTCNDRTIRHSLLCDAPIFQQWAGEIIGKRVKEAAKKS